MSIYSEAEPNLDHIRAAAQLIADKLNIDVSVKDGGSYCWISLPCESQALIQISEIDAGMPPLSAYVFLVGGMKCFFTADYKDVEDFALAVADYVKGFFGRQIRVTRETKLFGGVFTKTEYLEGGEWRPLSEESDKSLITRFLCLKSRITVNEYDFRII